MQLSLGNQANILSDPGVLEEALILYREEEKICRELGNNENLAISFLNQALITSEKNEPD